MYVPVLKYYDDQTDVAVLKIGVEGLDAFDIAARSVRVGERVYAIGNPRGLEQSISEGIVSGSRDIDGVSWIQHSAPISPGSSGGALISSSGELLGINSRTRKESQNLNFAVPAATLRTALTAARARTLNLSFPPSRDSLISLSREQVRALQEAAKQGNEGSLKLLRDAAEVGNAEAQLNLGILYTENRGVPQDYAQALMWFRAAAEQGNTEAQCTVGALYELGRSGTGVPKDLVQAAVWYRKAAILGDARGQLFLGYLYDAGKGVPLDPAQAAEWFFKSAEQGERDAENVLGTMYNAGRGVPKDQAKAASWYRKAAEHGHASAQVNLGVAYLGGEGVPQSYRESYFWIKLAIAGSVQGVNAEDLASLLSEIEAHLTATQLAQEQERARTWLSAHASPTK
jgi:TPR repeat protein